MEISAVFSGEGTLRTWSYTDADKVCPTTTAIMC